MKQFIFTKFLKVLEKLTGKKIAYFPKASQNTLTAVKSSLGFWYAGWILDSSDIANGILSNGVIEADGSKLVTNLLQYLLAEKPRLTFFDVGANTGYFGILAAFLGQGKISSYAFEPVLEFKRVEEETIKLNRLENLCKVYNVGLSNQNGQQQIFLAGTGSSFNREFVGKQAGASRTVKIVRLDDFAKAENLPGPDFMKIDVEGLELDVLQGCAGLLGSFKPVIWYESAKTIKAGNFYNQNFNKTFEFLNQLGYRIFLQAGEKLSEIAGLPKAVPDGVSMYLALHTKVHAKLIETFIL